MHAEYRKLGLRVKPLYNSRLQQVRLYPMRLGLTRGRSLL